MRKATSYKALLTLAAMLLMLVATEAEGAPSKTRPPELLNKKKTVVAAIKCPKTIEGIRENRQAVWRYQELLGLEPTQASAYPVHKLLSCKFAQWVNYKWIDLHQELRYRWSRLSDPEQAICHIFGNYCGQALAVARCESNLSIYATNGQYLGLFQMGSYARSTYGHSYTALGQAKAAYAYFAASGYDWSPWQCRPYGLAW